MTTVSITVILSEPSLLMPPGMSIDSFEDHVRSMTKHFSSFEKNVAPVVTDLTATVRRGSNPRPVFLWYKIDGYKIDGIHQHMNPITLQLAAKAIKAEMLNITGWNEEQLGVRIELLHSVYV